MGVCPVLDDAVQLIHAIGQCGGAGLQDVGGFDFKYLPVFDSRNIAPTCTRSHFFRAEFFTAPRTDDDVGAASGWTDSNAASVAYGVAHNYVFRAEFNDDAICLDQSTFSDPVTSLPCVVVINSKTPGTTDCADDAHYRTWTISATFNHLSAACGLTASWNGADGSTPSSVALSTPKIVVASSVVFGTALAASPLVAGTAYAFTCEALFVDASLQPPPARLQHARLRESRPSCSHLTPIVQCSSNDPTDQPQSLLTTPCELITPSSAEAAR